MKKSTGLFVFALASVLLWGTTGVVWAESAKGRWDIGGGVYFVSTQDDIRSNAAFVLFDQPGPDGIPNTGDETILFSDPRPDDLISRETTLQEGLAFNVNFAYGVTDWLSLQVDAGYYDANVVQLDTYVEQRAFEDFNRDGIWTRSEVSEFTQSQPYAAGNLTQLPLTLSFIFRFRKDSPLNPYLGVGGGWVFIESEPSARLRETNALLQDAEAKDGIRSVRVYGGSFPDFDICSIPDCPPFEDIVLGVEDGISWHAMGGVEYFFNSKLAIFFDARYTFMETELKINSTAFPENDQLWITYVSPSDTLPYCGDTNLFIPPGQPGSIFPVGFQTADNGLPGTCRPGTPPSPGATEERLQDNLLFQGGKIDLTNFNIGVGLRFYF